MVAERCRPRLDHQFAHGSSSSRDVAVSLGSSLCLRPRRLGAERAGGRLRRPRARAGAGPRRRPGGDGSARGARKSGYGDVRDQPWRRPARRSRGGRPGPADRGRPGRDRAGGAAGRGCRRRRPGGRHRLFRPVGGRRADRGQQGLREGRDGRRRRPDCRRAAVPDPRRGGAGAGRLRPAVRREGRRSRLGQGGGGHRGSAAGPQPRRAVRAGRHRGVPGRPGGQSLRDHRRDHGAAAPAGPGLQAGRRRRHRSQHRRDGRLHPAALGARRSGRRGAARRAPADRRRAGPAGHALRRACCTPGWR